MKLRPSRSRRRGRIEIIPMIDVMFFLLASFMLASLALQKLNALPVDLPRGQAETMQRDKTLVLTVTAQGKILLGETGVEPDKLAEILPTMLPPDRTIIVDADKAAPNGIVVEAMLAARSAGAQRFLFAVRQP